METDPRKTAERISSLLSMRKMRQIDLAATVGISSAAVSRYVNGSRAPKGPMLYSIARALGVSADYILRGEGEPCMKNKEADIEDVTISLRRAAPFMTAEEKIAIAEILFATAPSTRGQGGA